MLMTKISSSVVYSRAMLYLRLSMARICRHSSNIIAPTPANLGRTKSWRSSPDDKGYSPLKSSISTVRSRTSIGKPIFRLEDGNAMKLSIAGTRRRTRSRPLQIYLFLPGRETGFPTPWWLTGSLLKQDR